jgi:hypothetical protein
MRSVGDALPAFPFENAAPTDTNQLAKFRLGESDLVAQREQSLANAIDPELVVMLHHTCLALRYSPVCRPHQTGEAKVNKWELV